MVSFLWINRLGHSFHLQLKSLSKRKVCFPNTNEPGAWRMVRWACTSVVAETGGRRGEGFPLELLTEVSLQPVSCEL